MSDLLQVACPQCATRLSLQRPNAPRASILCTGCGHNFVFAVPPAAAAPPASVAPTAPVQPPSPSPGFGELDLGSLPPSSAATSSAATQHPPSQFAGGPPPNANRHRIQQRRLPTKLIAAIFVGLVAVIGAAAWIVVGGVGLPGSFSIFDSASSLVQSADNGDRELIAMMADFGKDSDANELQEDLTESVEQSRQLVLRAIDLSPVSASEAQALVDQSGAHELQSLIDDDAREAIQEQIQSLGKKQQATFRFLISRCASNHQFVREFLAYGQVELPEPTTEIEQIATERIEAMRAINRVLAKRVAAIDLDEEAEASKTPPTQEEIDERLQRIYGPATDDVRDAAELFHQLAERQYNIDKPNMAALKPYSEPIYYADQAQARLFFGAIGIQNSKSTFVKAFSEMRLAATAIDRATQGLVPSRIAAPEKEKAAAEQRERQRQEKIAAVQRERDEAIAREKAEQDKLAAKQSRPSPDEMASAATTTSDSNNPANSSSNEIGSPSQPGGFRPGGFRGAGGFRGPGGRLGPRSGGPMRGGQAGGPSNRGGRPDFGPREFGRGPARPQRPPFDPKTGVTIKMQDAGGLSSKDVMSQFSSLKSPVSVRIRNGEMTVEISYTGNVQNVAELIDFGTIESRDEDSRTIIVAKP